MTLEAFIKESNLIEGIDTVSEYEIDAHKQLLSLSSLTVIDVVELIHIVTCGEGKLRDKFGMDVKVGDYSPPNGSPDMRGALHSILNWVNSNYNPFFIHKFYETLHPFTDGNGRSGRAIWAWQMIRLGKDPFSQPFLQAWYYNSLRKENHG